MSLNIYLPHQYFNKQQKKALPVIIFLSGFHFTPDNPTKKSFIQPYANKYGFSVIFSGTFPRMNYAKYEEENGSSFYFNPTQKPWCRNFKMYSYTMNDLISNVGKESTKLDFDNMSICGHLMGVLGSLIFYLKAPLRFKSCSAFATHPSICPGENKYFKLFIGPKQSD